MNQPPLGQVCMRLGLLDAAQVERVLEEMREHGQGRFGELAVELNLLDEAALARALAAQFHLPLLPSDRLPFLRVPPEVLALAPPSLIRAHLVLPTALDEERRTLSVLTTDPTDLPALQTLARRARVDRLRIFVAERGGLVALVDRLLAGVPEDPPEDPAEEPTPGPATGGTVVLESDVEVAAALRRLDRAEGGRAQVVSDPEQVTALLRAGQVDRVLLRDEEAEAAAAYLPSWARAREGVQVAKVRGYGPVRRFALDYRATRTFYSELVLRALAVGRPAAELALRQELGALRRLARDAGLPEETVEAIGLVGLLRGPTVRALGIEVEPLLQGLTAPWDLDGLQAAFDRRCNRPLEPSGHLPAELLWIAHHRLLPNPTAGGEEGRRFHPFAEAALRRSLERDRLNAQLLTAGLRQATVGVQLASLPRALSLARRLQEQGFDPRLAGARPLDGEAPEPLPPHLLVLDADAPDAADGPAERRLLAPPGLSEEELARQVALRLPRVPAAEERTRAATGDSGLLRLDEVLERLALGEQSADVALSRAGETGLVRVRDGRPVAARLGPHLADEALEMARAASPLRYAVQFGVTTAEEDAGLRLSAAGPRPPLAR